MTTVTTENAPRRRIFVLEVRYSDSANGPWGPPEAREIEHHHGRRDWSVPRRHRGNSGGTLARYRQSRVVAYVAEDE